VGQFGAGSEICYQCADDCDRYDYVPAFDKAYVHFVEDAVVVSGLALGCVVVLLLLLLLLFGVLMDLDFPAEEQFADVGDDRVAECRDADRAKDAYEENYDDAAAFAVEGEDRGGYEGAEEDVGGVEDVEELLGSVVVEALEEEHADDARQCAKKGKRGMALQFRQNR